MEVMPAGLDRRALTALLDASRTINEQESLDKVLSKVTEQAAAVVEAEGASLLLLDGTSGELVFQTALGPAGARLRGLRMPADRGIAGKALASGHAARVDEVEKNPDFFPDIDARTAMKTRSVIAVPLVHKGKRLGVLEVINPLQRERFTDRDMRLMEVFANLVAAAMRNAQLLHQMSREKDVLMDSQPQARLVGKSSALEAAMRLCRKVAPSNSTVLLLGETGTGKEVAARYIHAQSPRRDRPFVAVHCAALSENLLESELFGHEKGAFTSADKQRLGRFELAHGGTLLLDEVGEINLSTQVKLLRVLQEREFVRVGGTQTVRTDVRLIAATNRDLSQEVKDGKFRDDLFYRLSVFPIELPALRARIDDVPALVHYFIHELAPGLGSEELDVESQAMACLLRYDWPGNIRELRNVVERCLLLADGEVRLENLPMEVRRGCGAERAAPVKEAPVLTGSRLAEHERALLLQAMEQAKWNQSEAARKLGITRDVLRYRIRKYRLKVGKDG